MEPISQLSKEENNVNNRLIIQPTSSITITRLNSKEASKKEAVQQKSIKIQTTNLLSITNVDFELNWAATITIWNGKKFITDLDFQI
ncbi:hypothetical protein BpHYR1_014713 [Brachionus plicatilis]|uniref:Uncharacterized protein n=1 Tax=Brachionus plicatilis TaxID=10195 RepID=A0A3M7RG96_BRAPC|nr:hypothetical protein BpHYR1_014713 [Brachionus plicatilis]